jgi:hypothetical protein
VLPFTVFAGLPLAGTERGEDGGIELVFTVDRRLGITTKGVVNLVGLATLATLGAGVFLVGGSRGHTRSKPVHLRASLIPTRGGVELALARQVEDGPASPSPAEDHAALRDRIADVVPAIRAYLALAAVFGPWARGTALANASAAAIEKRLAALGEPLASRASRVAKTLRVPLEVVAS